MAISKVVLNGTTLMDATTATATAEDIIAPKTAMLANGVVTTGTGTGGGSSSYSEACDPAEFGRTYTEGDLMPDEERTDIQDKAEAYDILTGVSE